MNRLFAAVMAVCLLLLCALPADACRRCGRSGTACHFHVPTHVPHVPAVIPPNVSNFIFNNSYPGPILPPGGASLFGYSLNAQGQYIDPAQVLDRAARITEQEQRNTAAAIAGFGQVASTALALNSQFNQQANNNAIATVAITALQANSAPTPQAALKVSINSAGETSTEWLSPEVTPENEIKPLGKPVISLSCGKCHNKAAEAPGGFFFDGKGMTREEFDWASESVWAGRMPKGSKLDRAGRAAVVENLRSMVK